ncbi:MAG: M48 family metalloprotease [Bacteroidetes bacterium]|nr:M48 family metalloprotease [Bacteroidota bacterium]
MDDDRNKLTYSNVFDYPLETDSIFRIFLFALVSITVIIGNYIPSFLTDTGSSPLAIFPVTEFYDVDKVFSSPPEEFFRNVMLFLRPITIQILYMILIFGISFAIYKKRPAGIIKKNDLKEINDREAVEALDNIRSKAGLSGKIFYYTNNKILDFSAQVFGAGKNLYLRAGKGLMIIIRKKNFDLFESILLHEFAHIKNRDISKTYFAESVLKIPFLITLLTSVILMFFALTKSIISRMIDTGISFGVLFEKILVYLNLFGQITILLMLLFLIFRMLIRSREYYADLRAASWKSAEFLKIHLDKNYEKEAAENFTERIFGYHPSSGNRSEILSDPIKIFKPSYKRIYIDTLVSYIFFSGAFIYGISFLLLVFTITGYSMLYLLKGMIDEVVHLTLVYTEMIFASVCMLLFLFLCGILMRKTFFFQTEKILITQKYKKDPKAFFPEIMKLSLFSSLGIISGFMLLPLYGFNVLYLKNLISIPFVFAITFTGFVLLNLFHYFWMDHKITNEYKVDYSVPVVLRIFEGAAIVIIFLSAILSFQFFSVLIFN